MKKISFRFAILLLISFSLANVYGQYAVEGNIEPAGNFSWVLLYKMEDGQQNYLDNADVEGGKFAFELPETTAPGIYRAYYQIENQLYVEFIFNQENVSFNFDPERPGESIQFTSSDENQLYQAYYQEIKAIQSRIDSAQAAYFNSTEKKEDKLLELRYKTAVAELKAAQQSYESKSQATMANHLIKASAQYNAEKPKKDPAKYIDGIRTHFFDVLDVTDSVLTQSSFMNDRLMDYVFYLNQSDNVEARNQMHEEAIAKAAQWIANQDKVMESFLTVLLQEYRIEGNAYMMQHVLDRYYLKLPTNYQDPRLINSIQADLKTALGVIAPDLNWKDQKGDQSLYQLKDDDYYIVLFFSSGCPHCQIEVPEFHEFISGIENIQVLTIGLEDEAAPWEKMTETYVEFINVLDLEKWKSERVKKYGVTAIPSYFVLDKDKRILAKPDDLEELKSMFEAR